MSECFKEVGMERVRRRRCDSRRYLLILLLFIMVFTFVFLRNRQKEEVAEAADLAKFDPGYIISDYQMSNYTSMTEAEIQKFLTAKNPCNNRDEKAYQELVAKYPNITWHFENGHFICLSEEKFGDGEVIGKGETAAHIIWQAAQDYKINPQVIIVLLQKEQGLITDTYPNSRQYRAATGYGCPDTAACSSKYYGFKNQVRNAALLFRTVLNGGWTNYPLGNNFIQYNPNASCGGSVVNVKNLATSSLYRYTPYQPNAAALAAGYGTASCGAYGNRNFYLYFEDWFGGITDEAPAGEAPDAPTDLKVLQADGGIRVTWKKPKNTGGLELTDYEVVIADVDKKEHSIKAAGDKESATFYGLPLNTYFAASVKAFNAVGGQFARVVFEIKNYAELTDDDNIYKGFLDMPKDEISKKAVSWAVLNEITDKNQYFDGETALTRRQAMVLLWRLAGKPNAKNYNGFSDMPKDEISKKAVSWAVINGVTDKNQFFNGEIALTRRQAMVLLWRLAGKPNAKNYNGFSDMPKDETSKKAVSWAVQNGITDKNQYFNGETALTRRQAMVLLKRFYSYLTKGDNK